MSRFDKHRPGYRGQVSSPLTRAALIYLADNYDRIAANGMPLPAMEDDDALEWVIALLIRKVKEGDAVYLTDVGEGN